MLYQSRGRFANLNLTALDTNPEDRRIGNPPPASPTRPVEELARRWNAPVMAGFKKKQAHTALADIHESIDELLHYRQHFIRSA